MWGLRKFAVFVVLGGALLTAGCGSMLLPASGPNALAVKSGEAWNGPAYGLVKLTPKTVGILEEYGPRTLTAAFGDHRPPPEIRFGIGDVLGVTIFEAAAGGLFIPAEAGVRPGNFVTLPNQPIDTKGHDFRSLCRAGSGRRQDTLGGRADHCRSHQESGNRAAGGGGAGDPEHLAHQRLRRGKRVGGNGPPSGPTSGRARA